MVGCEKMFNKTICAMKRLSLLLFVMLLNVTAFSQVQIALPENQKAEVMTDILGSLSVVNYLVGFFFVILTLVLKWSWKTRNGVKKNPNSPSSFSWSYWFKHNFKPKFISFISNLIAVFLLFRFASEIAGTAFSYVLAVTIGLSLDYFVDKLKKMSKTVEKQKRTRSK